MRPPFHHVSSASRREFLWRFGGGFGGLALAQMLGAERLLGGESEISNFKSQIQLPHHPPRAKRVIQLFMNGGASQMDLFDYKPELAKRHGQPFDPGTGERVEAATSEPGKVLKPGFDFQQHGQCGRWVSSLLPHLAGCVVQTKGPLPDKPRARLLYRGSPCVLTYWRSVLFTAAVIIAGCELNRRFPGIMALGLIIGPLILLRAVLHRLRTLYLITSVRVEVIEGLLSRSSRELRIADIRAINVTRTGISGLCGIGSITFSSAAGGDDDVVFRRVFGATGLKNLVRRLQDGAGVNSKP